jgi:aminoglycoside phosphotransferase (APT) family kinase protein
MWLHGDAHPANILVADGRVCAVVDFGDITAGDPATDLAVLWMLFPADCHHTFRRAYREAYVETNRASADHASADQAPVNQASVASDADHPLWTRARGWALHFALVFLAHSADNPQLRSVGRRTLAAVTATASPDGGPGAVIDP